MPGVDAKPKTLYDKVFGDHIVNEQEDGTILIYIGELVLESYYVPCAFC
jgi:3-isopropylmalate dehydratase